MTVELLDECADDPETVVIAHLAGMYPGRVRNYFPPGVPYPKILVTEIAGTENVTESDVDAVVSVHSMFEKDVGGQDQGWVLARDGGRDVHRRMLLLARYLGDVDLGGGRMASIDYVDVFTKPHREPLEDPTVIRIVARYRIGLSYVRVP